MGKILKKIKDKYLIEAFFIAILGIILFYTLFMNPIVGKCDNGDFARMYGQSGLMDFAKNPKDLYDGSVHRIYKINWLCFILPWAPNWVAGVLIAKISIFLYALFDITVSETFNISMQAFVYCVMYLTAVFMILKYKKMTKMMKIASGIFITVFFTDINYIAYFNSFFGEAAVIVFMLLFIGTTLNLISKENPGKFDVVAFFICSGGFILAKTQELPLLVFMYLVYGAVYYYYKDKRKITVIAVSIVTALSVLMFVSINDFTNMNNMYQAVFMGILRDSKNPEQDLEDLGLDKNLAYLKDYGFYDDTNPVDRTGEYLKSNFYSKMSSVKVLKYYLTHPDRMWEKMNVSAEHAYDFHEINKGNFEKGQYPNNKIVNTVRYNLIKKYPGIHRNIYIYLTFSAIYFVICLWYLIKYKKKETKILALMCIFLLASGSSQSILPIIGSGQADFGKHLFLLNLSYDVMIGVAIVWFIYNIEKLFMYAIKRR